jgi:hypothetical protein
MMPRAACALLVLALASCDAGGPPAALTATAPAGASEAEQQLSRRAAAMQRTVVEGALAGAVAGLAGVKFLGGKSGRPGLYIGIPMGIAAGGYVAYLQDGYATKEAKLERAKADIDASNAEIAAAIATMRTVLALQQAELAEIRASSQGSAALGAEVKAAETNLANMRAAINGAAARQAEFESTRSLRLVEGQLTGIDPEIAEMSRRIAAMREIADTLANDI